MINEQQTYEQIEKYLNDDMSSDAKQRFENELNSNEELMKLTDQHKAVKVYAQSQGLLDFKKKLKDGMPNVSRNKFLGRLLIGFSSVILLLGTYFLYDYTFQGSSDITANSESSLELSKNESEAIRQSSKEQVSESKNLNEDEKIGYVKKQEQETSIVDSETNALGLNQVEKVTKTKGGIERGIGTGNDIENNLDEIASEDKIESLEKEIPNTSVDCEGFDPRPFLKERASFNSVGEGKIEITNNNKDQSYFIYIDDNTRQKNVAVFEHLDQGSYKVKIENDAGCVYIKKYILTTKKVD